MKDIKKILPLIIFTGFFAAGGYCQISRVSTQTVSSQALNATPKSEIVKQQMVSASNGINTGNFSQGSITGRGIINQAPEVVGAILAAKQSVALIYNVPDRVWADRWLLSLAIQRRISNLVDAQDNYRAVLPDGQAKDQLVQMLQHDINNLYNIWNSLGTTCRQVSFKGYPAHVNADAKYKDPLSGVGLMRAENGIANFANIPYWEIEGQAKATELIYEK